MNWPNKLIKNNIKKLVPDIAIAFVITFTMFGFFIAYDVMERWFELTRAYENHELDEAIGLLLGFLIGLLFFTYRLFYHFRKDSERIYKLAASLEHEASYDHLTKLPNRRSFEKNIRDLIEESNQAKTCFTLFYIDLDSFKFINDTLGHTVGDKLLVAVTNRLSEICIGNSILARIGGDEFCIAAPGYADNNSCLELCSQLNQNITEPFIIENHKLYISHTVGISRYPEDGHCYEDLLRTAHIAMYMGKKSGQRRNNFKDGNFTNAMKMRFITQHKLIDSLQNKQLYVEYQPKINLHDNQLIGAEALVRWQHPQHGFIAPDEFIYIAEETKNVHLIDLFVLETVCKQIKLWGDIAKPVAVNLSPILFADENLVHTVKAILAKHDVPSQLIEFEITERTIVAESEIPLMICQQLVDAGISVSLDDFGTGYSSLSHIANFPISTLKIDRVFISQICGNAKTRNIVSAIISLAKALNIKVIAEGVETEEQKTLAKELACDEAQGYLFDKPLSKEEYFDRLEFASNIAETAL